MRTNLDRKLWRSNSLVCGLDEVGRGALAGPVVAGAVVLPRDCDIPGADDSKKLTARTRERLADAIRRRAVAVSLGAANHRAVDRFDIRQATFLAMRRAVTGLGIVPDLVIADGWPVPGLDLPCEGVVRGDSLSLTIACASIIAKVFRDELMRRFEQTFPGYGFARNKGYGTAEHLGALRRLGPSPIHRMTFRPVAPEPAAT
ncbi:MAG: ribonuclease HII [bacterium]